jgi:hypothetical protein
MMTRIGQVVAVMIAIVAPELAAADKEDVVEFGANRLIGEIKGLDRGKLSFKTEATDTITIHWEDVTRLATKQTVRVLRSDGQLYVGSLTAAGDSGNIAVVTGNETNTFPLRETVSFEPVEGSIIDRFDIDTSVGYSYTKANDVEVFDFNTAIDYETETASRVLNLTSQISSSQSEDESKRNVANYQSYGLRPNRWFIGWLGNVENNDELELNYRVTAAAIGGRSFFPAPEFRFRTFGGIGVNQERFDASDSRSSIESVFGATVDWYRYSEPELDLSSRLTIFPSLTDTGRVRSHLDVTLRWELYHNLFWRVSLYDEYDSDPQGNPNDPKPNSEDYGMSTGLGWTW